MRTCLVTGAARGIGAATAKALARGGWRVVINYRSSREAAELLAGSIVEAGGIAMVMKADVSDRKDVARMGEELTALGIRIDCLVHNAAAPFLRFSTSREVWDPAFSDQIATSCGGFLNVMQELQKLMSKDCLVLVLLTSALTVHDGAETAAYLAGKGALLGLCRGWNRELTAKGKRLILVSPGATKTDLLLGSAGDHPRKIELFEQALDQAGVASPAEIEEQLAKVVAGAATLCSTGSQPPHLIVDKQGIKRLEYALEDILL